MIAQRRTGLAVAAVVMLAGVVVAVEVGLRYADAPADARLAERVHTEGQVPIELLAVRFLPRPRLAAVDLQRGEVDSYAPRAGGLSREPIGGATLLEDGVAVWQSDGVVRVFLGDSSKPTIEHEPAEPHGPRVGNAAAPGIRALADSDGEGLWVIRSGACCDDAGPGRAELLELGSGTVRAEAELPPNSSPVAAVEGGLVLNTLEFVETADGWIGKEGTHAVLLLSEDGTVRELAQGEALAATGDQAAVVDCEQHEPRSGCRLSLVDIATGQRQQVEAPVDGTWAEVGLASVPTNTPQWAAVSRHGRILLRVDGERADLSNAHTRTRHLVAIDTMDEAAPSARIIYEADSKYLSAAWDERGEQVVVAGDKGRDLTVVDPANGSSFVVRDAIPADHYLLGIH